jgi:phospholipase/carboxylesterase
MGVNGVIALAAALMLTAGCDRNKSNQANSMTITTSTVHQTQTKAGGTDTGRADPTQARIGARPSSLSVPNAPLGEHRLGLRQGRDGLYYVPAKYRADRPAPLIVLLHGAGGSAGNTIGLLRQLADETGAILLVPESKAATWDLIVDSYGPDVELIDRALAHIFSRYSVDPAKIAISGFSDGASYALSLGMTNGELFRHILAFSPGFAAPASIHGMPRIFISHGDNDAVLPIDRCSRRIVFKLKRSGHEFVYREFHGPHTVPSDIAREAVAWLMSGGSRPSGE